MKKINVNVEACIGCGACVAIDPEHFAFNDEGLSHAISNDNLESAEVKNAIDSCPTSAISIKDAETTCKCDCGDDCKCTSDDNCGCHCYEESKEDNCDGNCDHCHNEED